MPTSNVNTTIFEVSNGLISTGQGLPFVADGDTVVGISTDGQTFEPVPDDGSTATVDGSYLSFAVDDTGALTTRPYQPAGDANQTLIDDVNTNDGAASPLNDSLYYQVVDSSGATSTYQYIFDLGDTGFAAPDSAPYSTPETVAPGTTVDIGGPTVSKALSADGTYGGTDPAAYTLSASVGVFDFDRQQADGTVSVDPTVAGGGGTVTYSSDHASVTVVGTVDQINADFSTLSYTAVQTGTDAIIISDVDSPVPSANEIIGNLQVSTTAPPAMPQPVADSTTTIYEISPDLGGSSQGLPFLTSGDTVVGISTDDATFTPVPTDGSSATVAGTYLSFAVDASGTVMTDPGQPNQALIDDVNGNDGAAAPLNDSIYYQVLDSSGNTAVYQYTFDLGDTGFGAPSTQPYSAQETTTTGTTIDIGGATVTKVLSSDGTYGGADPATYTLTASIGVFDFDRQAADGTVAIDPTVSGGGGTVSYASDDGSVTVTGTLDQINADLSTLSYTAVQTGTDYIIISDTDDPVPSGNEIIGSIQVDQSATCFCPGTLIRTVRGEVPVEALRIGDPVRTADGAVEPVKWIGRRSYAGAFVAGNHLMLPVCIKAGALADGVPRQDLHVSPGHAMLVDGCLVPVWRLLNGRSITQAVAVEEVAYYHIELEHHAVLLANGAPAESFLDDGCRSQFHNAAEFIALYPTARPGAAVAPRLEDGFALRTIQERIAARANLLPAVEPAGPLRGFIDVAGPDRVGGWAQDGLSPEEPVALEVRVGGVPTFCVLANGYRGDLRRAGVGSGCHAFAVGLPPGLDGAVTVHRVGDGVPLALTTDARTAGVSVAA